MRLDVGVTNRDGQPVDDLRSNEVEITEDGQVRPIVFFRHVGGTGSNRADGAGLDNLSTATAPPGHLYVLVFDQLHIGPGREQRARQAAERFVSRMLRPGDAVAVYGLPHPGPLLGFTSDASKARGALESVRGQAPRPIGGIEALDEAQAARRAVPPLGFDAWRDRPAGPMPRADAEGQMFLSQLAGVMQSLQVVEGRKALILFSEGFVVEGLATRLEQVVSAAACSNSVVYPVDLGGGLTAMDQSASTMSAAEVSQRREPLARLALETSGRLISGIGNVEPALAGIANEVGNYYLVAFEPTAGSTEGAYRRVMVRTTRPGLVVRTRGGYSAIARTATRFSERQSIDAALASPGTSNAIPIEYSTYERIGPTAGRPRILVGLTAYLPKHTTGAARTDGRADLVFVVRDAVSGAVAASGSDHLAAPAGGGRDADERVGYSVQFDVPPGDYCMRVLVREPGGVIGTADHAFRVWPLLGAVSTSDLIVARLQGTRFDPPARIAVHRDDPVLAYLEIYGDGKRPSAQVEILKSGSSEILAKVEPMLKPGSRGETILRAHLPIEHLADGLYTARVRVTVGDEVPRVVERRFHVVSGE